MHRAWAACGLPRTDPATGGPDVVVFSFVKALSQIIFSVILRASNHQLVDKKDLDYEQSLFFLGLSSKTPETRK